MVQLGHTEVLLPIRGISQGPPLPGEEAQVKLLGP